MCHLLMVQLLHVLPAASSIASVSVNPLILQVSLRLDNNVVLILALKCFLVQVISPRHCLHTGHKQFMCVAGLQCLWYSSFLDNDICYYFRAASAHSQPCYAFCTHKKDIFHAYNEEICSASHWNIIAGFLNKPISPFLLGNPQSIMIPFSGEEHFHRMEVQ